MPKWVEVVAWVYAVGAFSMGTFVSMVRADAMRDPKMAEFFASPERPPAWVVIGFSALVWPRTAWAFTRIITRRRVPPR